MWVESGLPNYRNPQISAANQGAPMRLSQLPFCIAIAALFCVPFCAPIASHADTYQIVGLGIDNVQFYGMDDSGHVVFSTGNSYCGGQYSVCYGSDANGWSGVAPAFSWDNGIGCSPTLPPGTSDLAAVCNNGKAAFYGYEPGNFPTEGLYSGPDPMQLVTGGFFTLSLHMNGNGDIVFDDGRLDEWFEAINLSTSLSTVPTTLSLASASVPAPETTPEPTSILLFSTGGIALAGIVLRRSRAA
jgi:hypothetical protein